MTAAEIVEILLCWSHFLAGILIGASWHMVRRVDEAERDISANGDSFAARLDKLERAQRSEPPPEERDYGWAWQQMVAGRHVRLPGYSECASLYLGAESRMVMVRNCNGEEVWQGAHWQTAEDMAATGWEIKPMPGATTEPTE